MKKTPLRYKDSNIIPALDGLRGIAIFIVLIFHYWTMSIHHPFGLVSKIITGATALFWSGVDLFFVLSGFLIGGILISNKSSKKYFTTFYIRRFTRIFPIYYCMFFLFLLVSGTSLSLKIPDLLQSPIPIWPFAFFIQNFYILPDSLQPVWLVPTWSLAVEEQFYIIIPALLWVLPRKIIPLIIGLIILTLILTTYFINSDIAEFYSPDRYIGLLLGVMTAYIWKTPHIKDWLQKKSIFLYMLLLVIFIGGIIVMIKNKENTCIIFLWVALLHTLILMIVLFRERSLIHKICNWSWLKRLGVISYGAYLYHMPIFYLIQYLLFGQTTPSISNPTELLYPIVSIVLTLIIANFSYKYIETKFLQMGKRFTY